MSEEKYRVEFNEEQQLFHLDKGDHEENTNGWFTVFDSLSYKNFLKYKKFIRKNGELKLTAEDVYDYAIDFYSSNLRKNSCVE